MVIEKLNLTFLLASRYPSLNNPIYVYNQQRTMYKTQYTCTCVHLFAVHKGDVKNFLLKMFYITFSYKTAQNGFSFMLVLKVEWVVL